ncbi:unnamed protein product [Symbiodinium necroappetens]|uniref:Transglutaminase-like domain-containing protein n=1 Tax=Symbiodinium necroappetens TaxID=1628268 RepID=A0A812JE77_9DINO|nr:unnamed protein product [Symbiodinium necroappetens]
MGTTDRGGGGIGASSAGMLRDGPPGPPRSPLSPLERGVKRHIPNLLTVGRLVGAGVFIALLSVWDTASDPALLLVSAAVFAIAVVTDALDGYLARKWEVVSMFGRVMDPLADKVIVLGGFVMLASPAFVLGDGRMLSGVASWMVVVILARELLVTAIRSVMEARGIDFSASLSGKLKMILQSVAIPAILVLAWMHQNGDGAGWIVEANRWVAWAVVAVTVVSGVPYVTRADSVLDRLGDVSDGDGFFGADVRDGEGGAADLVVGVLGEASVFVELAAAEVGVDCEALPAALDFAGSEVAVHLTLAVGVVGECAFGRGVHRGDKLEIGGEADAGVRPGDGDVVVFQRLAHGLEDRAWELGELVEEEDASVGEGDLTGSRDDAAADDGAGARGVVRRAHGSRCGEARVVAAASLGELTADGIDARDLERLFGRHGREDAREGFGHHGFAGPGRAEHEEVVPPRCRDGDGALDGFLAFDVREIDLGGGVRDEAGDVHGRVRLGVEQAVEDGDDFVQRAHAEDVDAVDDGGLGGVLRGDDDAGDPEFEREGGEDDGASDGADAPVEGEFAGDEAVFRPERIAGRPLLQETDRRIRTGGRSGHRELRGWVARADHSRREEHPDGHRQVVDGAFLPDMGWGKVHQQFARRKAVAFVVDGGSDTVERFLDGLVGEPDDGGAGQVGRREIELDLAGDAVDALQDEAFAYAKARPGYPDGAMAWVVEGLDESGAAVDVGAGTGLSTRGLERALGDGWELIAVEPNASMREAGASSGRARWVDGTGEATGLADSSADLIVAAQAFHWFEPDKAMREFRRVLRRDSGRVALVWNTHDTAVESMAAYKAIMMRHATEPPASPSCSGWKSADVSAIENCGLFGGVESRVFSNDQVLPLDGLIARAASSSYIPSEGAGYEALCADLRAHFERYREDDRVRLVYDTTVYRAEALGGDARVRELVETFYDVMDEKYAHLRGLHAEDLTNSRLTLYEFLSGWLGGPSIYIQKYGHPRLRMRHAHVVIDDRGVMEWISCMDEAMDALGIEGDLRAFLDQRFAHTEVPVGRLGMALVSLSLVFCAPAGLAASDGAPVLTRHRTNVRDWTVRIYVNLRPDRQRRDPAVPFEQFQLPQSGYIQFDRATCAFPLLVESSSHEAYLERLETSAMIKGHVATRASVVDIGPFPDEREAVYELGPVRMQDMISFRLEYPMTCYETRIDEGRAFEIEWPRELWPEEALAYLGPQAYVESDHDDVAALVEAWTKGNPRKAKPYYLAKFLTGRVLEHYSPTEGIYREQGVPRLGRVEGTEYLTGFMLEGAAHAARAREGSKNDLVNLLVAVLRSAGIPARLVIAVDPIETDRAKFPVFNVWAEFALYDEPADRLEWIPVDILEQQAFSSRAPAIDQPWEYFGKNLTLDVMLPVASRWEPLREGFLAESAPVFYGWLTEPIPQWCRQEIRVVGFDTPMKPGYIELEKRKERSRPPQHCPRWIRRWLLAAGIYNIVWGTAVVAFPMLIFRSLGLAEPVYPQIWQCVGMIVGVYGVGYLIASRDPARHWPIVLVGLLGKVFGPIGFVHAIWTGSFPWAFGVTIVTNDLIWYPAFFAALAFAWRSSMTIEQDIESPLNAREAMARFEASSGRSVAEESREGGLLVVFLRHAGCTFCREAMGDLRDQRETLRASGVRIVLVHMSRDGSIERLAAKYGLGDVLFVCDPDRELYRAFELRRGTLGQLFGVRVVWRAVLATLRGHGIGKLAGDGFQMPGAFLVRDGEIVRAYRHETAGDRPDYCVLASA